MANALSRRDRAQSSGALEVCRHAGELGEELGRNPPAALLSAEPYQIQPYGQHPPSKARFSVAFKKKSDAFER